MLIGIYCALDLRAFFKMFVYFFVYHIQLRLKFTLASKHLQKDNNSLMFRSCKKKLKLVFKLFIWLVCKFCLMKHQSDFCS